MIARIVKYVNFCFRCTNDEFTCKDGSCISMSWKCDRQIDCSDGSDESECGKNLSFARSEAMFLIILLYLDFEPPVCVEGEFPCTYQKCVRSEFKCDGDNDCGDWSDEDDCPKTIGSCSAGQFR